MSLRFVLIFTIALTAVSSWAASPRETRRGYLILKNDELYFTEIHNSTAPLYLVKWWNQKKPIPLCAVNFNPGCPSVEISFEKQSVSVGNKKAKEIIFTNTIYAEELKVRLLHLQQIVK